MEDRVAIQALDPELVLVRLAASRRALVRTILSARVGIAAAALLFATRPGEGRDGSWWSVAAFAVYLGWTLASAPFVRRIVDAPARATPWLSLEQGLCVGLVVLGGGVRVLSLYVCALPVIYATVFVGARRGLALATADALVVSAVLGGTSLAGATAGTEVVHGTEWPPAIVGLYIAVALFAYVRRLFVELEHTGVAYRARSDEIAAAAAAEARAQTRTAMLAEVASGLEGVVPELRERVRMLRRRRPGDRAWQAECHQLERLASHAQDGLDDLATHVRRARPVADTVANVVRAAVARVRALGARDVDATMCSVTGHSVDGGEVAEALGRFVEEALWNAHKYGRPPLIVTTTSAAGHVTVTVTDHGEGFSPSPGSARLGLESLRRDSDILGGDLRISAERGRPVTVALTFPATNA